MATELKVQWSAGVATSRRPRSLSLQQGAVCRAIGCCPGRAQHGPWWEAASQGIDPFKPCVVDGEQLFLCLIDGGELLPKVQHADDG